MKEKDLARSVKLLVRQSKVETIASLSVSNLARQFNVGPSYLSRSFNKYNKLNLGHFLEFHRIRRFEKAVRNQKYPRLKEVLALMNIRSISHFIKRYKKIRGRTPGQYCKEWREKKKQLAREKAKKKRKK